jgi:hypothetical protein
LLSQFSYSINLGVIWGLNISQKCFNRICFSFINLRGLRTKTRQV